MVPFMPQVIWAYEYLIPQTNNPNVYIANKTAPASGWLAFEVFPN